MAEEKDDHTGSDEDKRYIVTDRSDIVRTIRGIAKRKGHLLRAIARGGEEVPSMVLDVDPDSNSIYIDCSPIAHDNQRLETSSRVQYVTNIDGVKMSWVGTSIEKTTYDGSSAFRIDIPDEMQRLQRRECYRVDTPLTNPVICKLRMEDGNTLDVALMDVSIGGIGITLPDSAKTNLERGAVFNGAKIDLPGVGVVEVNLRVQMTWEITLKNGNKSRRAGLEFIDLRTGTESMIQRYMIKLERERIQNT